MEIFKNFGRKFYERGLSAIPVKGKGASGIFKDWQQFCKKLPSEEEFSKWENEKPDFNIGIAMGQASGLVAVDIDETDPKILEAVYRFIPESPVRKKGKKGETRFFRFDGHRAEKCKVPGRNSPSIEILSTGNQTIVPPSLHPETGKEYEWITLDTLLNFDVQDLPELPLDSAKNIKRALQLFGNVKSSKFSREERLEKWAAKYIKRGKSPEEVGAYIYEIDAKENRNPLFGDPTILEMADLAPRENALRFAVRVHEKIKEAEIPWAPITPLPCLLPVAPALSGSEIPPALNLWTADIALRLQVPLESVFIAVISALGSVMGVPFAIFPKQFDDWLVRSNLWGAIIAPPSQKKSAILAEAFRFANEIEAREREQFDAEAHCRGAERIDLETRLEHEKDTLKKKIAAGHDTEVPAIKSNIAELMSDLSKVPLGPKRLICNDATHEKLAELLTRNRCGLWCFRDEISGFLRELEKPGREGAREFFLEAWNGNGNFTSDRIGRGTTTVKGLSIGVMGGIQPDKLNGLLLGHGGLESTGDGLLQRFQLMAYPEKLKKFEHVDKSPSLEARARGKEIFDWIYSRREEAPIDSGALYVRFCDGAQRTFDAWLFSLEERFISQEMTPVFESHLGKYRSLFPALALIFHAVECAESRLWNDRVSLESANMAKATVEFLEAHARKIYAINEENGIAQAHALAKRIKDGAVHDWSTVREISRKHWSGLKSSALVEAGLSVLEDLCWVRTEVVQSETGAPSEVVRIHPSLRLSGKG